MRALKPSTVLLTALALGGCPGDDGGGGGGTAGDTEGTASESADGTSSENQPPSVPVLTSPANGAMEVPIESSLCWEPSTDPDGDPIRYRVFLDDIELTEGKLDMSGYEGPCLGPLNFVNDREYSWQVSAFNPDDPSSESDRSSASVFHTIPDGYTQTVFEDPFDDDKGWEIGGDPGNGAWLRGNPVPATHMGVTSQPDNCAGGDLCVFTGQNLQGVANDADVGFGQTTTMTSPEFDLSPFEAVTVTLDRFVYKSEQPETGTLFRVELLVPNPDAIDGYDVFVLDQIEDPADSPRPTNMWTPREYAGCEIPMTAGSRLRLVATDLGQGILEAAVDSVVVTGQMDSTVCSGGVGSVCNPDADTPCADDLLCCAQGVVNKGVFRCNTPVPGITYPDPGGPVGTMNGPLGCDAPDLFVEPEGMEVYEDTQFFADNSCEIFEECVEGPGMRQLLRFDTQTPNAGSKDLVMGVPTNHPDLFHFSSCHGHYHFDGYAYYELLNGDGTVAATGHKQAFCLLDWSPWAWNESETYTCGNQGISNGWQDIYGSYLDCQFIDITDVAPGDYTLRIGVNLPAADTAVPPLVERDYENNILDVPVTITGM